METVLKKNEDYTRITPGNAKKTISRFIERIKLQIQENERKCKLLIFKREVRMQNKQFELNMGLLYKNKFTKNINNSLEDSQLQKFNHSGRKSTTRPIIQTKRNNGLS